MTPSVLKKTGKSRVLMVKVHSWEEAVLPSQLLGWSGWRLPSDRPPGMRTSCPRFFRGQASDRARLQALTHEKFNGPSPQLRRDGACSPRVASFRLE